MHWVRRGMTALLAAVFVASFAGYVTIHLLTDDLLDPGFYTQALHENDIYNRVYSDLLADPAMRRVVVQLLGRTPITPEQSREAYGQIVSALRLVLPPEVIEEAAGRVAAELVAYLKGDRARLRGNISLTRAVYDPRLRDKVIASAQSVETVLIAQVREKGILLVNGGPSEDASLVTLYTQLEDYLTALANGKPSDPPPIIKTFPIERLTTSEKRQLARAMMLAAGRGASVETQRQIEAALAANDLPGALVIVSGALVNLRVDETIDNLRAQLDSGTLSGVQSLAGLADRTAMEIVREINRVRDGLRYFYPRLDLLMVALMGVSAAGLVKQHGRSRMRLLRVLGTVLVLAGGGVIVAWTVIETALDNPFATYDIAGIASSDLPDALAAMLDDVLGSLREDLRLSVWARGSLPLVIGVLLLAVSAMPALQRRLWDWFAGLDWRARLGLAAAGVLLVVGGVLADSLIEAPAHKAEPLKCNGHAALCDRPFNEVVFAATHNAMSVANEGWIWPNQDGGLVLQLEAGVRAMLIDTHYGDSPEKIDLFLGRLPADMRPLMREVLATADPALQDPSQLFLCHTMCSLGGIPLVDALSTIRQFLDDHPREVIVLLVQDGISTADTVRAFEESGLARYAYNHRPSDRWPTLGEMIAIDRRLVVFAEVSGPPPDWYHHMWDYVEETSYTVSDPADFNCASNRGGTGHNLFLMNHWITNRAPDRVDAARINNYSFLLSRARICTEARGQVPNFVAVDFYSVGDLFRVVDELNGVRRGS